MPPCAIDKFIKTTMKQKSDLIFDYWKKFVNTPSKPIKDWFKKENEFLKKNIQKNSMVLDVGIGYGRNIESIANIAKKIVGIDKSKFLLKEIESLTKKYPNIEFFCEDAKKMHFKDSSFDYVLCLGNTFGDFAKNRLSILEEMKRVCKKGGQIYISVYSENAIKFRIKEYERIGIKILKIDDGEIYTQDKLKLEQFNKKKLEQIFKDASLEVKIIKLNRISYMCVAKK